MIFAIGESLYDFTIRDVHQAAACPGGSMLNTSVSLARYKIPVTFFTEVGKDKTGDLLLHFLRSNHINTESIHAYDGKTPIALAFLDERGDATYEFYGERPGSAPDFIVPQVHPGDVMLFGSTYARQIRNRSNILEIAGKIKIGGGFVVYDPNYRKTAAGAEDTIPFVKENIGLADIVRGSDEDFLNLFGTKDGEETYKQVRSKGAEILIYTRNREGVDLCTPWFFKHYKVPDIQVVNTIGAGDSFNAGLLSVLHGCKFIPQSKEFWDKAIGEAIIFASEVCAVNNNFVDWPSL